MAGRLKRRSSVGQGAGRRESMLPLQLDSEDEMVAEEAERQARNRQRRQQQEQLDSPAPGGAVGASERADRRSLGGISGLTAAQLAEHYNNCIKLSAENKISTKNAFNLQLIDYMATMIKRKESDMSNFQVAAGTLDASTKIYAYRVDAVYGDTLKIASGLGHTAKQNEENNRDESSQDNEDDNQENSDANNPEKKSRKRIKKSATVEKNIKNLNVAKFELEFDVDPLFKKTSSQFDGATGGNQFLSTLEIRDETCELILDSESGLETNIHDRSPTKGSVGGGWCPLPPTLPTLPDSLLICPTFAQFSFSWSLDSEEDEEYNRLNESISASQEERCRQQQEQRLEEHAFDAFAAPEPVGDDLEDDVMCGDGGLDDIEDDQISERALGHKGQGQGTGFTATLPMTTADMLSALTTAPLEYSYFDHGKLGAWAGPKHWKFKPLARLAGPESSDKTKGKKKKTLAPINYAEFDENEEDMLEQIKLLMGPPKRSIRLVDKTVKSWSRDKTTLPEDLHYSGHDLVRLKICDQIVVAGRTGSGGDHRPETQVDDVEDYDYDNPADRDAYCPDMDNEAYDAAEDPSDGLHDSRGEALDEGGDSASQFSLANQEDYFGENLVEAPKLVDKAALQIGYAKTAKKVDMKRIKAVTWSILCQASSEEKENTLSGSPEKLNPDKTLQRQGHVEETKFSQVYRTLKMPSTLPPKMSENLSVSLAFLALLHLCNEENLEIIPDPRLDDFTVVQG